MDGNHPNWSIEILFQQKKSVFSVFYSAKSDFLKNLTLNKQIKEQIRAIYFFKSSEYG
jgi:hypothetical protein